jgi:predicted ATP-grasp superfamily ATP-dependent carboligase
MLDAGGSVWERMPELSRPHVVIAGVTVRAFAASAARAGYRVTAIDAFGDRDLRAVAEVILARPLPGEPYGPAQAAAAGALLPAKLAAYTSNFENYPAAVTRLAAGRRLLGNPAVTLKRVRNPIAVMRVLRRHELVTAPTRSQPPRSGRLRGSWLLKPRLSGGGHGIRTWSGSGMIPRTMYLQQRIPGTPGSISFAADGRRAVVLGFSRQLVAARWLGAQRHRYCGSIVGGSNTRLFPRQEELLDQARDLVSILTREFRLVGLNGIDFIAQHGIPYPLEVNPRYSASMELIERALGVSLFEVHHQACRGSLPAAPALAPGVQAKAIVFARHDSVAPDLVRVVGRHWIADIPHAGELIQRGRPICTVLASAAGLDACLRLLRVRADAVYRGMKIPRTRAA